MSTFVPARLTAGLVNTWSPTPPGYVPSDGWALRLVLKAADTVPLSVDATADLDADAFTFTCSPDLPPGVAAWQLIAFRETEQIAVASGCVRILPNLLAVDSDFDPRTHAEKMLDAIDALLEGRVLDSIDELEFTPPGGSTRNLKYCTRSELMSLKTKYAEIVRQEREAEHIAAGGKIYNYEVARFL